MISQKFGTWTEKDGLSVPAAFKWERRSDFGGASLVSGVVVSEGKFEFNPVFMLDRGTGAGMGAITDMLRVMEQALNFTTV